MRNQQHMQQRAMAIDGYIGQLAARLDLPDGERGVVLLEVRAHLEELAASLLDAGGDEAEAQRRAVAQFGDVRRLGRRLSAAQWARWGGWRWARGAVIGALLTWAIWTLGTFPVIEYVYSVNPVIARGSPAPTFADPLHTLIQATPVASGAFEAFQALGWLWLLPLLALYCVAPLLWGRQASRWWAPGLAYGLGSWLAAPWFVLLFFGALTFDWAFTAEAETILLALPLALLASFVGWRWRRWNARGQPAITSALA